MDVYVQTKYMPMPWELLKFCYVPATSAASSKGIFAVATNITNQTNKAGGTCLSFLDACGFGTTRGAIMFAVTTGTTISAT
jgi:hypothetical protein